MYAKETIAPQSRATQALQVAVILCWPLAFAAIKWQGFMVYLIPALALFTFLLLSVFPMILCALCLSGYLESIPIDLSQNAVKPLVIGLVWLAAGIAYLRARNLAPRRADDPRNESSATSHDAPGVTLTASLRHELLTPANLIVGFCELLLTPASPLREPVSYPHREHIEAIYRNGKRLQNLIEELFTHPTSTQGQSPEPLDEHNSAQSANSARETLIVLDEHGMALDLFKQHVTRYDVVGVRSPEEIGNLSADIIPAGVVVTNGDTTQVPVVAELIGKRIPILTCGLSESPQDRLRGAMSFLMKPVEFEKLSTALQQMNVPLQHVLIVDDNPDSIDMLAHMLEAFPQHPQVWKAYSGREALAMLLEQAPDVIILDYVLPDMGGLTLVDYLRTEVSLAHIPVLLVSAHRLTDIVPPPTTSKFTVFRMAGIPPAGLVKHFEILVARLQADSQPDKS